MALVRGIQPKADPAPDIVEITSLFTYSWRQVHQAAEHYRTLYPMGYIRLGGIYATLMPTHANLAGADEVHTGLVEEAEGLPPDYSLVPDWGASIVFGSRGCIRKCAFCAVPRLEGAVSAKAQQLSGLLSPDHKKVVLWDNNFLAVPNWRDIVDELADLNLEVDFNQGLDGRLITADIARELGRLRIRPVRLAYDVPSARKGLEAAIPELAEVGFKRDKIVVYTLYNFTDTPDDFLGRVQDLLSWGVTCYPMRYEPLNSLTKNQYISPHWTYKQVEMIARARRVIGYGGAFPPYRALREKLSNASTFEEAFSLRPRLGERAFRAPNAGFTQSPTPALSPGRAAYRELLNDPSTLQEATSCSLCGQSVQKGARAFAQQDYGGRYVGYVCPACHPNQSWVHALWRSTFPTALPTTLETHR